MPDLDVDRGQVFWVVVGVLLLLMGVWVALELLGIVVVVLFFYYTSRPVYERIAPYLPGRSLPAGVAVASFVLPALLLIGYTTLVGLRELLEFTRNVDSAIVQAWLRPFLSRYGVQSIADISYEQVITNPEQFFRTELMQAFRSGVTVGISYLGGVTSVFLNVVLVVATTFYFVRDDVILYEKMAEQFNPDERTLEFIDKVDRGFHYVFFGNVLNAVITGLIGAFAFTVVEVVLPAGTGYPVLIGLLCGMASLIPVVGMKLVYFPVSGLTLVWSVVNNDNELFVFGIAFTVVAAVVVDFIPDIILRPYVSGRENHIGALMIAYIVGPLLFGWYGLFLAPILWVFGVAFFEIKLRDLLRTYQSRLDEF